MKNIFFALALPLILVGCNEADQQSNYDSSSEQEVVGNPYDEGTGHDAGYKWAEENGGDCDGNSQSFNEGCEEYQRQMDEFENSQI